MEIYCAIPYLLSVPDQNPQIISNQAVKEWLGVFLRSRYKESIVTSGRSFFGAPPPFRSVAAGVAILTQLPTPTYQTGNVEIFKSDISV